MFSMSRGGDALPGAVGGALFEVSFSASHLVGHMRETKHQPAAPP